MSYKFLNLFKPNELTEDYHSRKTNDENLLSEIEVKKYVYVGEKNIWF